MNMWGNSWVNCFTLELAVEGHGLLILYWLTYIQENSVFSVNSRSLVNFTVNSPNGKAIPEKLSKFHPVLKLSNFEPYWLSFTYNGGTDLHLQINSWKNTKNQGGRCSCTGLHLMCITQAHLLSSYFILPLVWPNSLPYYVPMLRLQP